MKSKWKWIFPGLFVLLGIVFRLALPGGYHFSALIFFGIAGVITVYYLLYIWKRRKPKAAKICTAVFTGLLALGLTVAAVTEGFIIHASYGDPDETCEYVVVLGAAVHGDVPSLSLNERINAAYDYLTAHPDVQCVVSGGQGEGENMTEAKCMRDRLVAKGIPAQRIWLEERATSTWENLNFTLDLIQEKTGKRPEKLGVISSEYHLYRASLFAKRCGVTFVGIPAKTGYLGVRVNYYLREVAGVWHYLILGGQYHD